MTSSCGDKLEGEGVLLPCPFCGASEAELRESITDAMVACCNCGCRTGFVYLGASDAANAAKLREVANRWNTRQPLSQGSSNVR